MLQKHRPEEPGVSVCPALTTEARWIASQAVPAIPSSSTVLLKAQVLPRLLPHQDRPAPHLLHDSDPGRLNSLFPASALSLRKPLQRQGLFISLIIPKAPKMHSNTWRHHHPPPPISSRFFCKYKLQIFPRAAKPATSILEL
jgi:hypothetical protein